MLFKQLGSSVVRLHGGMSVSQAPASGVASSGRSVAAFDDHVLDDAGTAPPKPSGFLVVGRLKAAHTCFERRKLDHDEPVESLGTFHDAKASASRQHPPPMRSDDGRQVEAKSDA